MRATSSAARADWRSRARQYFTVNDATVHSLGEMGRLPPKLDVAGRKLTRAWFEKLLWGEGGGVRSYMTARMPRFGEANASADHTAAGRRRAVGEAGEDRHERTREASSRRAGSRAHGRRQGWARLRLVPRAEGPQGAGRGR